MNNTTELEKTNLPEIPDSSNSSETPSSSDEKKWREEAFDNMPEWIKRDVDGQRIYFEAYLSARKTAQEDRGGLMRRLNDMVIDQEKTITALRAENDICKRQLDKHAHTTEFYEALKKENERLKVNLDTCKSDYWKMTNLLENCTSDRDQAVKDCIERMKFRKPLFKEYSETIGG